MVPHSDQPIEGSKFMRILWNLQPPEYWHITVERFVTPEAPSHTEGRVPTNL